MLALRKQQLATNAQASITCLPTPPGTLETRLAVLKSKDEAPTTSRLDQEVARLRGDYSDLQETLNAAVDLVDTRFVTLAEDVAKTHYTKTEVDDAITKAISKTSIRSVQNAIIADDAAATTMSNAFITNTCFMKYRAFVKDVAADHIVKCTALINAAIAAKQIEETSLASVNPPRPGDLHKVKEVLALMAAAIEHMEHM